MKWEVIAKFGVEIDTFKRIILADTLNSWEGSKLKAERSGGMATPTRVAAKEGDEI